MRGARGGCIDASCMRGLRAGCIRAAVCGDTYSARLTRCHNDANVLCIGARVIGPCLAEDILWSFLGAEFEGGRQQRRVDQISDIEK